MIYPNRRGDPRAKPTEGVECEAEFNLVFLIACINSGIEAAW